MKKRLLFIAIPALLIAACATASAPGAGPLEAGRDGTGLSEPAIFGRPVPVAAPGQPAQKGDVGAGAGNQAAPLPQVVNPDRAVIRTANVAMRAKDAWAVSDRVQALAIGLGGDVIGMSQSGTGDQRSATLTLRVPSDRFDDAVRQIRALSDVEVLSSNIEGKDVTDQFVDLQARLRAKQAEEQRYLTLLARADKVEDILRIDQVLSQVRVEIERLTAQINSIKSRTEFSTISVSVAPLLGIGSEPGAYDPAKTLERALAALAAFMRVLVDVAIWLLVFGWIPLVILSGALLVGRARGRAASTT